MKLPTRIKIGRRVYRLLAYDALGLRRGWTRPALQQLSVSTHVAGRPRKPEAIAETFWHEVTHAILHDMDHPLWKDEKFVTGFSQRLAKAIDSARFE